MMRLPRKLIVQLIGVGLIFIAGFDFHSYSWQPTQYSFLVPIGFYIVSGIYLITKGE